MTPHESQERPCTLYLAVSAQYLLLLLGLGLHRQIKTRIEEKMPSWAFDWKQELATKVAHISRRHLHHLLLHETRLVQTMHLDHL